MASHVRSTFLDHGSIEKAFEMSLSSPVHHPTKAAIFSESLALQVSQEGLPIIHTKTGLHSKVSGSNGHECEKLHYLTSKVHHELVRDAYSTLGTNEFNCHRENHRAAPACCTPATINH
ncbi:hypothetical protein VNO77_27717 [Canavalia gladiata]|uniref:Uncharacterized protein n=1 Tax=Canavalia gladiata TaxID=3824 RepID=A0AAN9KWB2_CANGL